MIHVRVVVRKNIKNVVVENYSENLKGRVMPFTKINEWLETEKHLGSPNPNNVVLATSTKNAVPHSRIVAIREIRDEKVIFFTQHGKRKFIELTSNPKASMTLWLPLQQRQVVMDGYAEPLTLAENTQYWQSTTRDRQLKFSVYSPISQQPIHSIKQLEEQLKELDKQYEGKDVPLCPYYVGFAFIPETLYFYTLGTTTFSEVYKYTKEKQDWKSELISP